MITFLHLSDIHFTDRNYGTQFDLDTPVRRALIEDIAQKPANGDGYDGVLITGDIAYSGQQQEYKRAQDFLDELFTTSGALAKNTYMVPGNHDVNRAFVDPDLPLWAAHAKLRESNDSGVWHDHIYKQLVKDPQRSLLAPLSAYNDFAQGYDCFTGMVPAKTAGNLDVPRLAWERIFDKPLNDGSLVRIHGLNSALISDAGDAPGKLLVSEFQTSHFQHTANVIDLVMCHHPPEWLMDRSKFRTALRSFVPIALFGHEHDTRIVAEREGVQLFAGAVQPSRRDPNWVPTYHILQLSMDVSSTQKELVIRIYTREFGTDPTYKFRPWRNDDGSIFSEYRIPLPSARNLGNKPKISMASIADPLLQSEANIAMSEAAPKVPSPVEASQHELLVYFFQLKTPLRYQTAYKVGLLRDGDDTLDPQVMWAEVFRRAQDENKLREFWAAIANHNAAMSEKLNPF